MNVFQFESYKLLLKSYIAEQPNRGWGTLSKWSELISVKSSFIGQVLNGNKDLQPEHAYLLGQSMQLSKMELEYFIVLVSRDRSGHFELKNFYTAQLEEIRNKAARLKSHISETKELTQAEMAIYYSRWFYSAVRIYVSLEGGKTLTDISERFQIPRSVAETVLRFLCENEICIKKAEKYFGGSQRLMVHKGDSNYYKHLVNWRLQAINKSPINSEKDLFITSPMSLSLKDFEEFRAEILLLIKSISSRVEQTHPEEVFCLNIDLFKI